MFEYLFDSVESIVEWIEDCFFLERHREILRMEIAYSSFQVAVREFSSYVELVEDENWANFAREFEEDRLERAEEIEWLRAQGIL